MENKQNNKFQIESLIRIISFFSLKEIVFFILLTSCWVGIAPAWYEWFSGEKNADFCKWLYTLLDGNIWVNIPLCLVVLYGSIKLCIKIWRDRDIRIYRPLLVAFVAFVLYWKSNVIYARIIGGHYAEIIGTSYSDIIGTIDFRMFFTIILAILLLLMIIKVLVIFIYGVKLLFENNKTNIKLGFDNDYVNQNIPNTLNSYAFEIISQLLHTDTKNGSFAVGITGGWGTGKTTFLAALKKQIGNKGNIVEFNPWMCRTPEQVTNDFFATLQRQLSPKYSSLSSSIKEYAKYITAFPISSNPFVSLGLKILDKQDSLYGLKQTLSEKFSKLDRPVFVLIDDIDRLDRNEIFEVLRLIRNTADLSNIYYLVAFDKEYVTSVLEEKQIMNSAAYLEKIFPLEVPLPKIDDSEIVSTLSISLNLSADAYWKNVNPFGVDFSDLEHKIILSVLNNFRQAKRFERKFLLNVSYLNNNIKEKVVPAQVFWLELLRLYDINIYDDLYIHPQKYLFLYDNKYCLRSGILTDEQILMNEELNKNSYLKKTIVPTSGYSEPYSGDHNWNEYTPLILGELFGFYSILYDSNRSVAYPDNFSKYFTLSVPKFSLSRKELLFVLDFEKPYYIFGLWDYRNITHKSVVNQLDSIDLKDLTESQLYNYYFVLLLYSSKNSADSVLVNIVFKYLSKKFVPIELTDKVRNDVKKVISYVCAESEARSQFHPGLCRLINSLYNDGSDRYILNYDGPDRFIFNNDEIISFLKTIIEDYLKIRDLNVTSIFNPSGEFGRIFRYCCIHNIAKKTGNDEICHEYKNIAANLVISHFEKKINKPSKEEFDNAYNNMSLKGILILLDNANEEDYLRVPKYKEEARILYFGSNYMKFIEELKRKCCS